MMTKPLVLLAALILCCCITSLHAAPRSMCRCVRTVSHPIPFRVVQKIEIIPISGSCRRLEIIINRRNGSKVCVTPGLDWVNNMVDTLQNRNMAAGSTAVTPTDATIDF